MGYAASPIARILGPLSGSFQLDLVIFAAIGMCHAMIIASLYRISKVGYVLTSPESKKSRMGLGGGHQYVRNRWALGP